MRTFYRKNSVQSTKRNVKIEPPHELNKGEAK